MYLLVNIFFLLPSELTDREPLLQKRTSVHWENRGKLQLCAQVLKMKHPLVTLATDKANIYMKIIL